MRETGATSGGTHGASQRSRTRLAGLLVVCLVALAAAPAEAASTGELTQKAESAGCVADQGLDGCVEANALNNPAEVAVSPDGASVYVASSGSDAVTVFDRDPATGAVSQKPGVAGCVSQTGSGGVCADGTALNGAFSVAVSPDGASVYVASVSSDAVAVFNRNQLTGGLTQKPGTAGCVSETGSGGLCTDGEGLAVAFSVAVSPDGASVYVASGDLADFAPRGAVAVFNRNPTSGTLSQKPGTAGCISETGSGGLCADGKALVGPRSITVSPDGASVYVASVYGDAVAVFERDPQSGTLTQKAGTAGCVSETGSGGHCTDGKALDGALSVTVSADGSSVYLASLFGDAIAIFHRDPSTGRLIQKPGLAGCVSQTGSGGLCRDGRALDGPGSVVVSPDDASVYVASSASLSGTGGGVAVFDRNASTGRLNQKPGLAGCVSETGNGGACGVGAGLVGANAVTVSPDGASVYVGSFFSVAIFDRITTTG